jgi:hypothetical protein
MTIEGRMADPSKLNAAVDALDAQHHLLGKIAREKAGNWKLATVRARRDLSQRLATVSSIMNSDDDNGHSDGQVDTSDRDRVRVSLSNFRRALAMHQASYPAVAIEGQGGYRDSANKVDAAHANFVTLVRQVYGLSPHQKEMRKA